MHQIALLTRRALAAAAFALVLVTAGASPAAAASANPDGSWLSSLAAARAEAARSGKPILVDMYADWCGWCRVLDQKVFSTQQFRDYAKQFVLLRLDTEDGADGTMLSGRHGGDSLPVSLLLRHDLVEIGRVQGYAPLPEYIKRIDAELERWRLLEADYQQALASNGRPGPAVDARAVAEELHRRGDGQRAASLYRQLVGTPGADPMLTGWTRYLLADALRMAGEFEAAQREIADAKRQATGKGGGEQLLERLDLLTVQVAEDRGDCRSQVTALESFLQQHPQSDHSYRAKRTLQTLKTEGGAQCS